MSDITAQKSYVLLLTAALSLPFSAFSDDNFVELSLRELVALEVFTSASLVPTQTQKAPGTVYSFQRQDFDRFGVRRLDDLLAFIPGLQLNQYRKRHRSIWARGLLERYNDKMVLMIDGVRTRHLYYGHFSLGDNLPLERVEKVEVILGPASSLYGANAFGGIISITTRQFSSKEELETSIELANNNRKKGAFLYNSQKLQLFASALEQDAPFRKDRKSFTGSQVLQPLDEEFRNLNIKTQPVSGLTLGLSYNKSGTPFLTIPTTQDAFVQEEFLSLTMAYEQGEIESGRIESQLYYQDDQAREYEIEQVTRSLGYEEFQDSTMAGMSATYLRGVGEHTLAVGSSWQYEKAERTNFVRLFHFKNGFLSPPETGNLLNTPRISNYDGALFVQDVWQINPKLNLTLGGRYDYFDSFGGYFNYRAAASYAPDERNTWKAQYGTAIRTPTFREYLKVLEGTTFAPPKVHAEEIRSFELGYQYLWEQAKMNLNLFHNDLNHYIREVPTADGADEYFANSRDNIEIYGADLLFNIRPIEKMNLRIALAYLKSDDSIGEIPYLANWSSSLALDYRYHPEHIFGMSLVHNSNREDTNHFIDDDPDAFIVMNLFGSGQLTPQLSYRFGIDNLLDERIYDSAADFGSQHNTERSRREIWLSLKWTNNL